MSSLERIEQRATKKGWRCVDTRRVDLPDGGTSEVGVDVNGHTAYDFLQGAHTPIGTCCSYATTLGLIGE